MPIKVVPTKSKSASKGSGGMDIGKTPKKKSSKGRVSDQDVERLAAKMASAARGTVSERYSAQDLSRAFSVLRGMISPNMKAGGGKAKKMMAKGGTAGGKKKMMGGGKAKKMMRGGGKTKKYMARGGKAK